MTDKELLNLVDLLLKSVPNSCKEEVRTNILVLGVELLKDGKNSNYIFISMRNKKYETLRATKRRMGIITAGEYIEDQQYDKDLFLIKQNGVGYKKDTENATREDRQFVHEKYEILYTAFVNMTPARQRFLYYLLKEHWNRTRRNPRKQILISEVIKKCGVNLKTGMRTWRMIKKDIMKIYNQGRVNYLDRIKDFETLYHLIVCKGTSKININSREWGEK